MNDQASWPIDNPRGQLIPAAQTLPTTFDPYGPLAGYGGARGQCAGASRSQALGNLAHSKQAQMAHP